MTGVASLCLARAIAAHAEAAARAERAEIAGDAAAIDRLSGPEADALDALMRALPGAGSPEDVAAVVEHARHQGGREAAVEVILLRSLAGGLAKRLAA